PNSIAGLSPRALRTCVFPNNANCHRRSPADDAPLGQRTVSGASQSGQTPTSAATGQGPGPREQGRSEAVDFRKTCSQDVRGRASLIEMPRAPRRAQRRLIESRLLAREASTAAAVTAVGARADQRDTPAGRTPDWAPEARL